MCGEALVAGFALGRVIYAEERRDAEERVDEFALSARARLAAGFALGWVGYAEESRDEEERLDESALSARASWLPDSRWVRLVTQRKRERQRARG